MGTRIIVLQGALWAAIFLCSYLLPPQCLGGAGGVEPARREAHGGRDVKKSRARDLGIEVGILPPGQLNAITDVPGVLVGHKTVDEGSKALCAEAIPVDRVVEICEKYGVLRLWNTLPPGAGVK